ncbi:MAG: SUMF1/EgtB/PvdO family nonheme iron enzyme [Caldilineaceae bacterium]|nr:SUMF1/EgtB/PvdO family nonheme iron enzyme [Caldilineaceae bacterium]
MLRGGSWNNNATNVRTANRNRNEPDNRNNNVGFRLVAHGFHLRILRRPRLAQREQKAGAASSWPSYPHLTSPIAGEGQIGGWPGI